MEDEYLFVVLFVLLVRLLLVIVCLLHIPLLLVDTYNVIIDPTPTTIARLTARCVMGIGFGLFTVFVARAFKA